MRFFPFYFVVLSTVNKSEAEEFVSGKKLNN